MSADRWFGFPPRLRIAVIAAVWFGYAVLVLDLNALDSGSRSADVIWAVCLAWAALSILANLGLRSRFSSIKHRTAYFVALRTGEVPASLDAEECGRWLGRSTMAHAIAPFAWGVPLWFGVFSSLSSQSAYGRVTVWAFVLLSVMGAVAWWRRFVHIERLRAALKPPVAMAEKEAPVADTPEEAWLTVSPVARVLGLSTIGFTIALLALVLADLDSVVFGDARLEHLKWACAWAAPLSLVSPIAVFGDPTTRRRGGVVEPLIDYERAVRTGELPSRIEPEVWRRWLRTSRWFGGFGMLWPCFFAAVGAWAILTDPTGYHWVVASLLQLLVIRLCINWWRLRARLAQLAAEVDRYTARQYWG
jgi:hypothetical protein